MLIVYSVLFKVKGLKKGSQQFQVQIYKLLHTNRHVTVNFKL